MNKVIKITSDAKRADVYLSKDLDISRSKLVKYITNGNILLNNKIFKPSQSLSLGDIINISVPEEEEFAITPTNTIIDVIYSDKWISIINKQKGLVVHPGSGKEKVTLVSALLNKYGIDNLSNIDNCRPGIIHRIDKDTTGAIIIAHNNESHKIFSELIKNRKIDKYYLAYCKGIINSPLTIDKPIGRNPKNRKKFCVINSGKEAITKISVIKNINNNTMVECKLITGRTHQIRVHLAYINHPIIGDEVYYKKSNLCVGQALHSYRLEFYHPFLNKNLTITAKPPTYMEKLISM